MKKSIQRESSRGMLFIRLIELQSKLFWHPPLSPTITETCYVLDKCELSLENHLYNIKKGVREKENKKKRKCQGCIRSVECKQIECAVWA